MLPSHVYCSTVGTTWNGLPPMLDLPRLVMAVVAGRPDAADLTDVAAVAVAIGIDEILDLVARLHPERGQERLGARRQA